MKQTWTAQGLYASIERQPLGQLVNAFIAWNLDLLDRKELRYHDRYNLVYTLHGQCTYVDAGWNRRKFGPGDGFFVFPDVPSLYGPTPGHDWAQLCIGFDGAIFHAWRTAGVFSPERISFHLQPVDYWAGRMKQVIRQTAEAGRDDTLLALCAFQSFLAEVLVVGGKSKISASDRHWLAAARRMLESVERADLLDLEKIAEQMNMSYVGFRKKFNRLAGIPPARFHARLLMQRACQFMYGQRATNGELAEMLGYSSEFHFSRRFHQIMGMQPQQFRAETIKSPRRHSRRAKPPHASGKF